MKKILFCLLSILIFLYPLVFNKTNFQYIENILDFDIMESCFILNENQISNTNLNTIKSSKDLKTGGKYFVYANRSQIKEMLRSNFEYAEFVIKSVSYLKILKVFNLHLIKIEKIEDKNVYYGYSCNLYKEFYLNNVKINMQIIQTDTYLKIGYPMIYSSF